MDNQVLSLFNIHFKSRRGGIEQTRHLRDAQAEIVRRLSRPRVEQGSMRSPSFTAVVGDFNDEPGTSPLNIVQGKRDTSYNLESATVELPADEKWTSIFSGTKQQLDHILLSRFTFDRMTESGITRVEDDVSDHDPVWASLDLTLPPPE